MEKVGLRPWCGQPSDRGRLKNRNRNINKKNYHYTAAPLTRALPLDPAGLSAPRPPTIQKKSPPLSLSVTKLIGCDSRTTIRVCNYRSRNGVQFNSVLLWTPPLYSVFHKFRFIITCYIFGNFRIRSKLKYDNKTVINDAIVLEF